MKTVKFNEPTLFEGAAYKKDSVYELPDRAVFALGSSVTVLSSQPEPVNKAFDAAPVDKMVKKAAKSKNI
jgi:hypothetical protein